MKVVKRNCETVDFDKSKIVNAILKAMQNGSGIVKQKIAEDIADEIYNENQNKDELDIYTIEQLVFDKLIAKRQKLTARAYEGYRSVREFQRNNANTTDNEIQELLNGESDYWQNENSNKNATLVTTQRDYMAGITSQDITRRCLLPPDIVQAHDEGIIHFHDMDYFGQRTLHNCDLVNLEDMLQNGTVISGTMIEKPHSFATACNIATQIIAQVASCQYGGQSITLSHLAPFVDVSRKKIRKEVEYEIKDMMGMDGASEAQINEITERRVREEIRRGVQTIQYQVITLMTTNGQSPFLTVFMYLNEVSDQQTKKDLAIIIEETLKQRIEGVKNEVGAWVTPAFPKLIYVLEEDNIYENSPYWYLTELAAKCTAKHLVPDYISEKMMLKLKIDSNGNGNCYPCMGCRSFLTPYVDENGKPKYYGRFNQGVVTINLVDIALSSGGDMDEFWNTFEERAELCHKALQYRHKRLEGTLSDVAPILWQSRNATFILTTTYTRRSYEICANAENGYK